MSRGRRWGIALFALLLASGFGVIWSLRPAQGVGGLAAVSGDYVTDALVSVGFHGVPIALALAIAVIALRPMFVSRPRRDVEVLRLDATALDIQRESEKVEDKRRAVVTHRFTCPVCGGTVAYIEGDLPIACGVDARHLWPHERAFRDALVALGNQTDADRLALIVAEGRPAGA